MVYTDPMSIASPLDAWTQPKPLDTAPLVAIGCMNFGARTREDEAVRIIERALERGVTFFDTANAYAKGESERILGRALGARRGACQIASKVGYGLDPKKPEGLAPARVLAAIDESLERLGTDHLDLYYLHVPDHATPIEETLGALHDVMKSGKARAWGVSNFASWQVLEMIHWADTHSMPRPKMAQHMYNLLVRQLDVEWFRFATKYRLHTTVYNPLAGGLLTDARLAEATAAMGEGQLAQPAKGTRFDGNKTYQKRYWSAPMVHAASAYRLLAGELEMTLTDLAYAFAGNRQGVDSVILGPGSVAHLDAGIDGCKRRTDDRKGETTMKRIDELHRTLEGTDAAYAR